MSELRLSTIALEISPSTVSRLAMASVKISWCFLVAESSFLLGIISPGEVRAKQPPTPPNGIVPGRPTTDRVEAKLALENVAKRILELAALQ